MFPTAVNFYTERLEKSEISNSKIFICIQN